MNKILTYILCLSIAVISAEGIIVDGNLDEPEWEDAYIIDEYYDCLLYTSDAADD